MPSAAAELVVPDARELNMHLAQLRTRLARPLFARVELMRSRLESLANRPVIRRPLDRVHDLSRRLDELDARGQRAMQRQLEVAKGRLQSAAAAINALSPLATIGRGYSVTQRKTDDRIASSVDDLRVGERIVTRLKDGRITSLIETIDSPT